LLVPLDESGAIGAPAPCVRCGYDLRGLTPQHQCPECGAEVLQSLSGDMLRFADAGWLIRLRGGLKVLIVGDAINLGYFLLLLIRGWPGVPCALSAWYALGIVVNTIGVLTATVPQLDVSGPADPAVRRVARGLAAPVCILALLQEVFRWIPVLDLPAGGAGSGLGVLIGALVTVLAISFVAYLLTLLRRTRQLGLRFIAWAGMGGIALSWLFGCVVRLAPPVYAPSSYHSRFLYNVVLTSWALGWFVAVISGVLLLLLMILARRAVGAELGIATAWRTGIGESQGTASHAPQ
jgi:hypothetical protein